MSSTQIYRLFRCALARRTQVTPHMIKLTFHGDDLDQFGTALLDQRIKVILGEPRVLAAIPEREDWYAAVREAQLPLAIRTYTVAGVRHQAKEVDVDFVSHGTTGPASQFALEAEIGSPVVLAGPNHQAPGNDIAGIAWRSPAEPAPPVLLVGDETALPAIANIIASLPSQTKGNVLVEIPTTDDVQSLPVPEGMKLHWCPRTHDAPPGSALLPTLRSVLAVSTQSCHSKAVDTHERTSPRALEPDQVLWEEASASSGAPQPWHCWFAGETGWVKQSRHIIAEAGIPKESCSFMGYWRHGFTAEN